MASGNSSVQLARRRARLAKALEILEVEIAEIDEELNGKSLRPPELTEAFFWEQVFPRLLTGGEMTSAHLRRQLEEGGNLVDDKLFRTFLSRTRKRGLVSMRERQEGQWPTWSLTEQAVSELKHRVTRK